MTEVGRAFLGDVREMLGHLDRAKMATQAVAYGKRGRLRLAASEDVMTVTLARGAMGTPRMQVLQYSGTSYRVAGQ